MLNKKFKVRVTLYARDRYVVQFAHYYFFPIYKTLQRWFECGLTSGIECWSVDLFCYEEAEYIAKSLKSIDDVHELYKKDKQKEIDFHNRKKAHYKKMCLTLQSIFD